MREWDPIGARDEPNAQDEYDSYAMQIYSLLMKPGTTTDDLERYLFQVETKWMGLGDTVQARAQRREVAEQLFLLRSSPPA